MTKHKIQSAIFYYMIRPMMNRLYKSQFADCPVCGKLFQKYDDCGFVHLADGDADCYGALGAGKGSFK